MCVIETNYGTLRGETSADVTIYRGIPYAYPPIHELRFAAPEPIEPWRDLLDATVFKAAAMQVSAQRITASFGGKFSASQLSLSEDCLYLNVWVPNTDTPKKPVMVWIHGGAFRMGSGGSPQYEASKLAVRGDVIVVTINYRVGCFGFAYAPDEVASNAGLRDQIVALRWIASEISAFGGNPQNITVFGQSAGAKSAECLLASPLARGLFNRVILQSSYKFDMRPEKASAVTANLLDITGSSNIAALKQTDPARLLAGQQAMLNEMDVDGFGAGFLPVVDGEVLPCDTISAMVTGAGAKVPLVVGTNRDESRLFGWKLLRKGDMSREQLAEQLQTQWPEVAAAELQKLVDEYDKARRARGEPATPIDIWFALSSDRQFRIHSLRIAEAMSRHAEVYNYLFNWRSTQHDGILGACHGLEMPFVFDNWETLFGHLAGSGPVQNALSALMQRLWLTFARDGEIADWPHFSETNRLAMTFDASSGVEQAPQEEERRAYLHCFM